MRLALRARPVFFLRLGVFPPALTILALLAGAAPSEGQTDGCAADLLLRNARVVDLEARTVREGGLRMAGGTITGFLERSTPTPDGCKGRVVDVEGRWVVPGLWDMHVHSWANKDPSFRDRPPLRTANAARVMLFAGITGFLDLFGPDEIFDLRTRQRAGGVPGADIHAAGPILTAPGGHGTQFDVETWTVDGPADARRTVDSLALEDPDVVKLVYHPEVARRVPQLEGMDESTMRALVEQAGLRGLRTVAHVDSWDGAWTAVDAGVDAVTHTPRGPVPDSLTALMRDRSAAWIPTLAVRVEPSRIVSDPESLESPLLQAVTDSAHRASFRNVSDERLERARRAVGMGDGFLRALRTMDKAGVPILAGTDAGNPGVFHGFSLHRELELYVDAGMSAWDALASATIRPGRFLRVPTGVRPGDRASLVVLDRSPLEDIRNTRTIHAVIHHGRIMDRDRLLEPTRLSR